MVSDGVAAAVDSSMQGMTFGIVLGCALIMLVIPVIEKLRKDRRD
jgi:NhaP-type Na+/H+ or K+/H+ antiporter